MGTSFGRRLMKTKSSHRSAFPAPTEPGERRSDGHQSFLSVRCPACGRLRWNQVRKSGVYPKCYECSHKYRRILVEDEAFLLDRFNRLDDPAGAAKEIQARRRVTQAALSARLKRMGADYEAVLRAHAEKEAAEIAKGHGGSLLGPVERDGVRRFSLQCGKGHPPWEADLWRLKGRNATWCPKCGHERIAESRRTHSQADFRKRIEQIGTNGRPYQRSSPRTRNAASETRLGEAIEPKGAILVSLEKPVSIYSRAEIRCNNGHLFSMTIEKVERGQWCPTCRRRGKVREGICRFFFEHFFDRPFPPSWPGWLRGPKGNKLELDGFNEEKLLAFEYHGQQHFEPMAAFKMDRAKFEARQHYDKFKREKCRARGVKLIEIPYTVELAEIGNFILAQIRALGAVPIRSDVPDYRSFRLVDDRLASLQTIAQGRGGRLLSTSYLGSAAEHRWICDKGHEFLQRAYQVKTGVWCPFCAGKRRTAKDVMDWAQGGGLRVVSTLPAEPGNDEAIRFRCHQANHKFTLTPRELRRNRGCRRCSRINQGRFIAEYARTHPEVQEKARLATVGKRAHNSLVDEPTKVRIIKAAQASVPISEIARQNGLTRAPVYRTLKEELSGDDYARYMERVRLLHSDGEFVRKTSTGWTPRRVVRGRSYGLGVFETRAAAEDALEKFRKGALPLLDLVPIDFYQRAGSLAERLAGHRRPKGRSWEPGEAERVFKRLLAGATYEEISKEHGISLSGVKQRLTMAGFSLKKVESARFRRVVEAIAAKHCGQVLGEALIGGKRRYRLQCAVGHAPWWLRAAEVGRGQWCPACWAERRKTRPAKPLQG